MKYIERGALVMQYVTTHKRPTVEGISRYLADRGHHPCLRSCQRYLALMESIRPIPEWRRSNKEAWL